MNQTISLLLCVALLVPLTASAQEVADQAELGYSYDALSSGYADWNSTYLDYSHQFGLRHSVYAELRQTHRFNLRDREISAGYYQPLDASWTLLVAASMSPDYNVLPRNSLFGQVEKSFADGWDVQAGLRHSVYSNTSLNLSRLAGERYWDNFRASYAWYLAQLQGAGAAASHNFQLSYYFPGLSYVTLGVGLGRQVDDLGTYLGMATTSVRNASISGRYWLDRDWGVSYEAIVESLSSLYTRKGIRLGLRHSF